jgi:3-hydroxyisobutyrate dehydrogenase-like beta-hydroxyacid dehydrogenase
MTRRIGFIGQGEAGFAIAAGLAAQGATVSAFDLRFTDPEHGAALKEKVASAGIAVAGSTESLVSGCDIVVSAVVSSVAEKVAAATAPWLKNRHLFLDINSASPQIKLAAEKHVAATGAAYVDVAVMAAVPPHGHKVPLLASGPGASAFAEHMTPYGMVIEVLGPETGQASATKMFRSIIMKGLEAVVLECLLGAGSYGMEDRVLQSVQESIPEIDWQKFADRVTSRTAMHAERRAHEMEEVADTLRAVNLEPYMALASAHRIQEVADLGVQAQFQQNPPKSYSDVVKAILEARKS